MAGDSDKAQTNARRERAEDLPRSAAGGRNPWLIAVIVSLATFMLVLDTSIANVALRNIAGSLAAGVDESTWVITTYLVANSIVLPVSGWLANVIGRKRYYMICVATFTAASLLCGLATNLPMLIVFRILQGLGGGGMAPSEQAILADTFPPAKRAQAFALYGIAVLVAPTIGPTLGGWLTDNYSWHWIFFINVPIGILSLVLVQWLLVEPPALEDERKELLRDGIRVDWIGFVLVACALGCLEIVLDRGQREDWFQSSFIVTFALVSAVSIALFVPWECFRPDPIVDVRLLFQRQFGLSFLVMTAVGAILFSSLQLLPQLTQTNFQYTAELSGLALMPGGLAMIVAMPIAGQLTNLMQPRYWLALGMAVVAVATWHMTSLAPTANFGFFVWTRVWQIIALPFLFLPINTIAYSNLRPGETGQASALINVARNLGGSIGVSLTTTELAQRTQFHQSRLVENIIPSALNYQEGVARISQYFLAQGTPRASAQQLAIAWIDQLIGNQAMLLAYIDVFWATAVFALFMIPVALLLRRIDLSAPRPAIH
ncbi:MAG TPA: DHA2 family efflux MFS transporter permease subunit [Xanthobacteraceae bacterium]|jgi:DHA2 family multidrug resistance protein|nr:DHA2 family efflux MFS transporter permease subunit [Xanthobacteraceae bacterium]